MTCKECSHVNVCGRYALIAESYEIVYPEKIASDCEHFKDHSRFVELPKAHWVRHSPNKSVMREFHKQGIGSGMSENSIFWTCSNCGGWGVLSYKYCPFCGAKIKKPNKR